MRNNSIDSNRIQYKAIRDVRASSPFEQFWLPNPI